MVKLRARSESTFLAPQKVTFSDFKNTALLQGKNYFYDVRKVGKFLRKIFSVEHTFSGDCEYLIKSHCLPSQSGF